SSDRGRRLSRRDRHPRDRPVALEDRLAPPARPPPQPSWRRQDPLAAPRRGRGTWWKDLSLQTPFKLDARILSQGWAPETDASSSSRCCSPLQTERFMLAAPESVAPRGSHAVQSHAWGFRGSAARVAGAQDVPAPLHPRRAGRQYGAAGTRPARAGRSRCRARAHPGGNVRVLLAVRQADGPGAAAVVPGSQVRHLLHGVRGDGARAAARAPRTLSRRPAERAALMAQWARAALSAS